jgi:hypothetical protein
MLLSASLVFAMMADAATAMPKKDKNDPDKMVCRREVVTGSLVQTKRTCHTKREWEELGNAARRDQQTLRERSMSATSN